MTTAKTEGKPNGKNKINEKQISISSFLFDKGELVSNKDMKLETVRSAGCAAEHMYPPNQLHCTFVGVNVNRTSLVVYVVLLGSRQMFDFGEKVEAKVL